MYFIANPPRFRAFGDVIALAISLVTALRIWQDFPFAFHGSMAFGAEASSAVSAPTR